MIITRTTGLVLLLLLVGAGMSRAQEGGKIYCGSECAGSEYPYLFCKWIDGSYSRVTKCSTDPNNELLNGYTPIKKAIPPSCVEYDDRNLIWSDIKDIWDDSTQLVFSRSDVPIILQQTLSEWTSLCPGQPPNEYTQDCCLKVQWARNSGDLGDALLIPAVTWQNTFHQPTDPNNKSCKVDCFGTEHQGIYLNDLKEWTREDEHGYPQNFFYTDAKHYAYYNLHSILLHELGHWFGFGHQGIDAMFCFNSSDASIMGPINPGYDKYLTDEDKCMFMKLYCCKETEFGVKEAEIALKELAFELVPNPAGTSSVDLELPEPSTDHVLHLRFIDTRGAVVIDAEIPNGARRYTADLSRLANGVYFVTVQSERGTFGRKLLVVRR